MNKIKGKAFVLGNNIDTDQIIPANYLVYDLDDPEERKLYGKYALSGLPDAESGLPDGNIPFVREDSVTSEFTIIIGSDNFGCGSSREHAPVALNMAGVKAVVANSYARIFYRNSVDGGYIVPFEAEVDLSTKIVTGDIIEINPETNTLTHDKNGKTYELKPLGEVASIVNSGGIFEYARMNHMIK